MYTAQISNTELERLYWSAGLTEIADVYARLDIEQTRVRGLEAALADTPSYDDLNAALDDANKLRDKIENAEVVIFALYERASNGWRPTCHELLDELDKIKWWIAK